MYEAEVTFNIYSEKEFTWEESFDDLQKAVDWIKHVCLGQSGITYINGTQVYPRAGVLFDSKGNEVCSNPAYHEIFAPYGVKIPPEAPHFNQVQKEMRKDITDYFKSIVDSEKQLRVPTNPETFKTLGKPL